MKENAILFNTKVHFLLGISTTNANVPTPQTVSQLQLVALFCRMPRAQTTPTRLRPIGSVSPLTEDRVSARRCSAQGEHVRMIGGDDGERVLTAGELLSGENGLLQAENLVQRAYRVVGMMRVVHPTGWRLGKCGSGEGRCGT